MPTFNLAPTLLAPPPSLAALVQPRGDTGCRGAKGPKDMRNNTTLTAPCQLAAKGRTIRTQKGAHWSTKGIRKNATRISSECKDKNTRGANAIPNTSGKQKSTKRRSDNAEQAQVRSQMEPTASAQLPCISSQKRRETVPTKPLQNTKLAKWAPEKHAREPQGRERETKWARTASPTPAKDDRKGTSREQQRSAKRHSRCANEGMQRQRKHDTITQPQTTHYVLLLE